MSIRPTLSIVVPVFDGAAVLEQLVEVIDEQAISMGLSYEILFVDDGSEDRSWEVIGDLAGRYGERVKGLRLARNSGQQAATYCGLLEAHGEWVATMDDDMQVHPNQLAKLWDHAQASGADIVYGVFEDGVQQGFVHRVGARLFRMLLRRIAPRFPDGSSFRLLRGDLTRILPRDVGPWLVVDPVLTWYSSSIGTVPVEHRASERGASKYSTSRLFTMALRLLFTHSAVPLRVMMALGLLSSVVSFGVGIYYLIQKITLGAPMGFSALIVSIAFFSGMILLNLGVLGEYVSRIHTMGSREPAFAVRSRV